MSSKGVTTLGVKEEDDENKLKSNVVTQFRSLTMRATYLSLDRPELVCAVMEVSRRMHEPTQGDWNRLKKTSGFILKHPRLAQKFQWYPVPKTLCIECDTDLAGCIRTRKSTSRFVALWGKHCVRARSKTQSVIATSTAEIEFYSLCSAAPQAIGQKSLLKDMGETVAITIGVDASAEKAMASKRKVKRAKPRTSSVLVGPEVGEGWRYRFDWKTGAT